MGTPSTVWCDNGTKFVGAEKELLNCIQSWNAKAPQSCRKRVSIGFKHHGGEWKLLDRCCTKTATRRIMVVSGNFSIIVVEKLFCAIIEKLKLSVEVLKNNLFVSKKDH